MGGKYIAGIDIGTTGAKTGIFDVDGNIRASGYREYTCSYPRAGWVDQDPVLLVTSAMDSAKEALSVSGINPSDVDADSVSAQRSCTIFVDKEGKPVRPMISWQDAIQGKWQLEGLQAGAAGVFRWFRDEIATLEKETAKKQGKDPYEIITDLIEKTPPGSKGLLFLPRSGPGILKISGVPCRRW